MTITRASRSGIACNKLLQADLYMYHAAYVDEHGARVPAHHVTTDDDGELVLTEEAQGYRDKKRTELLEAIECADTFAEWCLLVDALGSDVEGVEMPERFRGECAA